MRKSVKCGDVIIGGGFPISIQSMTNCSPYDILANIKQIESLTKEGCQIVRLAIPDMEAAEAFLEIKKKVEVPLVADIHFDYRLALAAINNGADKIRINPGNIGGLEKVRPVVEAAKKRRIPIRIGVNSGSLEKDILNKYGGVTPIGLAESAIRNVKLLEDLDFDDIVVSLKASNVKLNYDAHKIVAENTKHPIHIGITEAGTINSGRLKSAIGIGGLLLEGIGDTMRVSLTGDPINEIVLAKEILSVVGIRSQGINLVSCPTCGRTKVKLDEIANAVEKRLKPIANMREKEGLPGLTVAVMGCVVNGPGEASSADIGVACGDGKGLIFQRGKTLKTVTEDKIVDEIIKAVLNYENL